MRRKVFATAVAVVVIGSLAATVTPRGAEAIKMRADTATPKTARFATFNASLNCPAEGEILRDLSTPDDPQARGVAEIIQRARPDILLLNEFDYVPGNRAVEAFQRNYLNVAQHGAAPIEYPYAYTAPVNTGVPSGLDLNNDGVVGGPDDAFGFGEFPGQYGMVVLSKYPIDIERVRTFQQLRWKDMPGALLPDDPHTSAPADWFSENELEHVRLSSKSHWDVPIRVHGKSVHFLVSHPTPPSFDGQENRNGKRNHDEIRFWADYVTPWRSHYIYDDAGSRGGLAPSERFVIAGDQNADPVDGESVPGAVDQLRKAPRVLDPQPTSRGALEASRLQGGANAEHRGDPALDTADFDDESPGNLRVDYLLPGLPLWPARSGVFWPTRDDELARLNKVSDHHLLWLDLFVR